MTFVKALTPDKSYYYSRIELRFITPIHHLNSMSTQLFLIMYNYNVTSASYLMAKINQISLFIFNEMFS